MLQNGKIHKIKLGEIQSKSNENIDHSQWKVSRRF